MIVIVTVECVRPGSETKPSLEHMDLPECGLLPKRAEQTHFFRILYTVLSWCNVDDPSTNVRIEYIRSERRTQHILEDTDGAEGVQAPTTCRNSSIQTKDRGGYSYQASRRPYVLWVLRIVQGRVFPKLDTIISPIIPCWYPQRFS